MKSKKIFFLKIFLIINFFLINNIFATKTPRIIGGNYAHINGKSKYPWIGRLWKKNSVNNHYCGVSLIKNIWGTDEWGITAFHCINHKDEEELEIFFDIYDLSNKSEAIKVDIEKIIPYGQGSTSYDIALLKLKVLDDDKDKIKNLEKINLITENQIEIIEGIHENILTVVGWGATIHDGENYIYKYENYLKELKTPICSPIKTYTYPYDDNIYYFCDRYTGGTGSSNKWIAAGEVGKNACKGDSGGPLFKNGEKNEKILVGIVSHMLVGPGEIEQCADHEFAEIYTRVSYYLDWIEEKILENTSQNFFETHIFSPGWHLFSLPGKFF